MAMTAPREDPAPGPGHTPGPGPAAVVTGAGTAIVEQLRPGDLWIAYAALGGRHTPEQVEDLLRGRTEAWSDLELDILTATLSELMLPPATGNGP